MTISDAQFTAWLAGDNAREILYEQKFAYESGGAPVEGTVYMSLRGYATTASESPANQPYPGRIRAVPRLDKAINPGRLGGITSVGLSDLVLDNADGGIDYFLRLIIDGREAKLLIGAPAGTPGWTRADFRTVAVMVAESARGENDDRIVVTLRDQRLLLDKAIAGDVVADERRKPLVFTHKTSKTGNPDVVYQGPRQAYSVELVLKDAATLEYYALQNFNTRSHATAIYDNGLRISMDTSGAAQFSGTNAAFTANAATDTLTFAGHGLAVNDVVAFINPPVGDFFAGLAAGTNEFNATQYWVIAAGLTPNDFRLSLTRGGVAVDVTGTTFAGTVSCYRGRAYTGAIVTSGIVQLSSSPAGIVTADLAGSPSIAVVPAVEVIRSLMIDYGGISNALIDGTSFDSAHGLSSSISGYGRAIVERENLLDVLDEFAQIQQVWFGPDHLGVWYAGRLNLSGLASATATRTLDVKTVIAPPKITNAREIIGTVALRSQRNVRPLTFGEFAGAVTDAQRQLLSAEYRELAENTVPTGTSYATNWQGFYKTAIRREFAGAFASEDAVGAADEILGDLKPHLQMIEVETDLRAYEWRLGDVVSLTYPRYTFSAGQNCRLVSHSLDLTAERVHLVLLTQTTPDYTSATH